MIVCRNTRKSWKIMTKNLYYLTQMVTLFSEKCSKINDTKEPYTTLTVMNSLAILPKTKNLTVPTHTKTVIPTQEILPTTPKAKVLYPTTMETSTQDLF